ncbi:TIGR02594 family protein [Morganella psychrotolerans]|uniref:TIGR02594 family protein n=1 Tax=Morganella psychrotolerans TaxID=368603 RepID=A0A1B8HBI6_9GAMM|nr:TIGR02594 family protein [Morganella psychrotolerans]OBU06459.1 TIGR02594 family protein [Morganella psychrotolerans]
MSEPKWITEARKEIGVSEHTAAGSTAVDQMWIDSKLRGLVGTARKVPWCAGFVNTCLERAGIRSTRSDSSRSYLAFGDMLKEPAYGCVVTFSRNGGGHVGFVVGKTESGQLMVLGGNQSDAVNIKAFGTDRVTGYRWPSGVPLDNRPLPVGNAALSVKES